MHHESMTSLFAVTLMCIRIFCTMRYNETDRDCRSWSLLEIVSPQFGKYYPLLSALANISQTSRKQFPIVTSTPVTICIIVLSVQALLVGMQKSVK